MNIIELAKEAGFIVTGTRIESPYIGGSDIGHCLREFAAIVRAEREWVDLTDDEILMCVKSQSIIETVRRAIHALKEKNK